MNRFATFTCLTVLVLSTGNAIADDEDDAEFTKRLDSTSDECTKVTGQEFRFTGKVAVDTDTLSVSACGNIADGLRAVCSDNTSPENKGKLVKALTGLKGVVCEYAQPKQKTAIVKIKGSTMTVWTNIEMSDPSERARCMIAKSLGVKYKGDLDKSCFERK